MSGPVIAAAGESKIGIAIIGAGIFAKESKFAPGPYMDLYIAHCPLPHPLLDTP